MDAQARLGVPENGRTRAAATGDTFDVYSQQLLAARVRFLESEMSLSSIEHFHERVKTIADAMACEATTLRQRSQLRDAAAPIAFPPLGELIDEVSTTAITGRRDSIIPPALVEVGHEDYPEARE